MTALRDLPVVMKFFALILSLLLLYGTVYANVPARADTSKTESQTVQQDSGSMDEQVILKPGQKKKRTKPIVWVILGLAAVAGVIVLINLLKKPQQIPEEQINRNYDELILGIEWITIPSGNFLMGDNFAEGKANELPVHNVFLDSYKIAETEITFTQFDRFCEESGRSKPDSHYGRGDQPVIRVSWEDANDFCEWLSEKTGKFIQLPSEAQWERAARGTDQRRYPWGDSKPNCNIVNYTQCGNQTQPVASFPDGASPNGLLDMAGNVWEWCADWFSASYYTTSPAQNPTGPASGTLRVFRGGGWSASPTDLRSVKRDQAHPSTNYNSVGFRVVWVE